MKNLLVLSVFVVVSAQICPDTTPAHHYALPASTFKTGLPLKGAKLPSKLTTCELYELQTYCRNAINKYRTTNIKFSDGRLPPANRQSKPALLDPDTPMKQCVNEKALSDLTYMKNGGQTCAHYTSKYDCGLNTGTGAENSCCARSCTDLASCKATLDGCLKSMWDEGQIVLNTGSQAWTTAIGHYLAMSGDAKYVVCGFGFNTDNAMLSTQTFFGATSKVTTTCKYNCGTSTSASAECGKCSGVQYCTAASQCKSPPVCFSSSGACKNGRCAYTTPVTTCQAGTCVNGKCVQQCADSNCATCSVSTAGGCTVCKSGFTLKSGACVDDSCVKVSNLGTAFDGTYRKVGEHNGQIAYRSQANQKYYLVNYCCGWGWSITASATGGSNYKRSDVAGGTAVQSSGKWNGLPTVTITHCTAAALSPTKPPTRRPTVRYTANLESPPQIPTDAELQGTCGSGYFQDCTGTCWEPFPAIKAKLNDGYCDDFTSSNVDLNCARLKCDMADCPCASAWNVDTSDSVGEPSFASLEELAAPEQGPPMEDASAAAMAVPLSALIISLFGSHLL